MSGGWRARVEMQKVSVTGGEALSISTTAERPQGASWGIDDRIVFASMAGLSLRRVSADGGTLELLASSDASAKDSLAFWPLPTVTG